MSKREFSKFMHQLRHKVKWFFILGAAKCGTTSLSYYLSQHPKICMSLPKEPFFFEKEFQRGVSYYLQKYFAHLRDEVFLGDARNRNMYLPFVPERIRASFPDAKLIVIVRNPIDRAYSAYMHRKLRGFEKLSFEEAIDKDLKRIEKERAWSPYEIEKSYLKNWHSSGMNLKYRTYIDSGYYAEQIERYLKYFDRNRILIVSFDKFIANPHSSYLEILKFLDPTLLNEKQVVDFSPMNVRQGRLIYKLGFLKSTALARRLKKDMHSLYVTAKQIVYTISSIEQKMLSKDNMDPRMRSFLVSHFYSHNRKLENLTGWDLSIWDA